MAKIAPPAATENPTPANAPVADPSAAPGTEDAAAGKPGRGRQRKPLHPVLKPNEEGKPTAKIVDGVPDDYNPAVHRPLKKGHFEHEHVFLRWKADQLEAEAAKCRKEADLSEKFGSSEDRKKAKRIRQMQDKMAALRAQLEEQGIDVDALLTDDE